MASIMTAGRTQQSLMKLSRTTGGLILGVATFASAMLQCEHTRGQNVYSLNIVSYCNVPGPFILIDHQCGVFSAPAGYYGIQQGRVLSGATPEPDFKFTAFHFGSHSFRVRTPECLIANRRPVTTAAAGLLALTVFASILYFVRFRPVAVEPE
jgi:hypothetical protein